MQKFFQFRISEITSAGFSGTTQQTLVQHLPGLPDLFRCPCLHITPHSERYTTLSTTHHTPQESEASLSELKPRTHTYIAPYYTLHNTPHSPPHTTLSTTHHTLHNTPHSPQLTILFTTHHTLHNTPHSPQHTTLLRTQPQNGRGTPLGQASERQLVC